MEQFIVHFGDLNFISVAIRKNRERQHFAKNIQDDAANQIYGNLPLHNYY